MADCLIGLGSNIGDRAGQLDEAIRDICHSPDVSLQGSSRCHETSPIGGPSGQDSFLNAVIRIVTNLSPEQLMERLSQVERRLGRNRIERWGPRTIDIDLLLYDSQILETADLQIPHRRMATRRFVLEPACEVGPEMIHGPTGWTLQTLLARLDESPCYVAVCCADERRSTQLVITATAAMNATVLCASSSSEPPPVLPGSSPQVALRCALDVLAERRNLLTNIRRGDLLDGPFLSDFWLNQSLALAQTWPPGPEREQLRRAALAAIKQATLPHFILHLDMRPVVPPAEDTMPRDPDAPAQRALATLATQLRRQTTESGQGPVLRADAEDTAAALVELRAGVDAMR